MTERLDRIEAALEKVNQEQQSHNRDIDAIIESLSNIDVYIEAAAEAGQRTDARLSQLTEIVANNAQQIANNSQQIALNAQQIAESGRRFDSLVERIEENNQRFNILIEEARADRAEWRSRFDQSNDQN